MTLSDGTSSEATFESDFQAVNETHRPRAASRPGIARIDRCGEDGGLVVVWPVAGTKRH